MPPTLPEFAAQQLTAIRAAGRYRQRLPVAAMAGARVRAADGAELRVFCSNDYLGLAGDPQLRAAWCEAAGRYGVGSTASQYVNGHSAEIAALETELAEFLGYPRVLLFGSGYLANTGLIDALLGRGDQIIADELNHASLIDGCRLSRATVQRYRHADAIAAGAALAQCPPQGHRLLVSDAVFSMDGDQAPLSALVAQAREHAAWLLVDDAHGLGVLGPQGRGSVAQAGLDHHAVPLLTGTLGKSLGVYGAYVAGDEAVIDYLSQCSRTAIFSTALPPALVAAARCALRLLREAEAPRRHLVGLIAQFRAGLQAIGWPDTGSSTPIQPLIVGSETRAMQLSQDLRAAGFWITAIRPPTVPPGTCRLRVTLSAAHSAQDVADLLAALAALPRRHLAA